jgi:iron complex outermembrane receptor protein
VLWGIIGEWRIGRARLFLNAENLANVRQSQFDPLLRPSRRPDGRWTEDVWMPLEGRVVNGGVRVGF